MIGLSMYDKLLNFPILHGRFICSHMIYDIKKDLPEVNISDDIHILTVVDRGSINAESIGKTNFNNGKVNYIFIDEYVKWVSKIEELKNYIENNYDNLPNYILYLDAFDTLILKDILNPKYFLDYYKCKVLFNAEPAYHHTGFPPPEGTGQDYYDRLYYEEKEEYKSLNKNKYGHSLENALNAGVFLGEKDFVLSMLKETYEIMKDDPSKGFPFGCQDDQCTLRFVNNKYYEDIAVDIFNIFSFWGCPEIEKQPGSIYSIDHFKQYREEYENKNR